MGDMAVASDTAESTLRSGTSNHFGRIAIGLLLACERDGACH
jgi:hypothetical protein